MKSIQLMNKIAKCGIDVLPESYSVSDSEADPHAIMVRSTSLHELEFNKNLLAITRCGAGVNNIPIDRCTENGIVVFNTPGANANGVKELAICALLLASRKIVDGVNWANNIDDVPSVAKAVEKGKSAFGGCEIAGKTLGVIGLGAIGGLVANVATSLGMFVTGCDPYITVNAAWSLSRAVKRAATFEDIYKTSDYITVHVPATESTKNMINKDSIAMMKDGVKIINLSRADIVNADDIKEAIASGKVSCYITDFPTEETINVPGIITIPHLGASTAESEDNCAIMAAQELTDFLQNGNIKNSVNFPNCSIPHTGDKRICVMHKNVPAVLSGITSALSVENINIENMANASKGDNAYTIVEIKGEVPASVTEKLNQVAGIIRVFVI